MAMGKVIKYLLRKLCLRMGTGLCSWSSQQPFMNEAPEGEERIAATGAACCWVSFTSCNPTVIDAVFW